MNFIPEDKEIIPRWVTRAGAAVVVLGLLLLTACASPDKPKVMTVCEYYAEQETAEFVAAGFRFTEVRGQAAQQLVSAINRMPPETYHKAEFVILFWRPDHPAVMAAFVTGGCITGGVIVPLGSVAQYLPASRRGA